MEDTSPPVAPNPFLPLADYAVRLGVSIRTLRRLVADGLPVVTLGPRLRRVEVATADAWVASRAWEKAAPAFVRPKGKGKGKAAKGRARSRR